MDLSLRRVAVDLARGALTRLQERLDGAPAASAGAMAKSADSAPVPPAATLQAERMDGGCGTGSLCGESYGSRNWFGSPRDLLELQAGLPREVIDWLCVDELMDTIVTLLPGDACAVRPQMTGRSLGELDDVYLWLQRRSFGEYEVQTHCYSFKYGGGATIAFVDDGRRADQPVDLKAVRGVLGFYSLPRHWCVPDTPSADVTAAWWGARAGLPSHYWVNPSTAGASWEDQDPTGDIRAMLRASGQRFHASRVMAVPYRTGLDWRTRRLYPNWQGWGPGIVEGCVPVFEARRWGMLRVADFMNGLGYDVLTAGEANVTAAKSTPSGGSALKKFLQGLKACRDMTGDGVPVVALDAGMDLKPLTRQAAGIHDLTEEQRKMLLDYVPYPRVVLFKETTGGLNGGAAEGEWQAYHRRVRKYNKTRRWPGLRHAAILAMAAKDGPTGGEVDLDLEADFPSAWEASDEARSESRKRDAEAREKDAATLGLTPRAMTQLDPTIERSYPGVTAALEAAEARRRAVVQVPAGLPTPALAAPVEGGGAALLGGAPEPAAPAVGSATTTPTPAPTPAENPAATQQSDESPLAGGAPDPGVAAPVAALPTDLVTEVQAAKALGMSRAAFRKWAQARDLAPDVVTDRGSRGGHRWSAARLADAMRASVSARLDAAVVRPADTTR